MCQKWARRPSSLKTRTDKSHSQYHSCKWLGNTRSQVISNHGINQGYPESCFTNGSWCHSKSLHYMPWIIQFPRIILYLHDNGYRSYTNETFNSLWPNDAICQLRFWSTLALVMECCLTAPRHYLSQCWLLTGEVPLHSPKSNFTTNAEIIILCNEFENYTYSPTSNGLSKKIKPITTNPCVCSHGKYTNHNISVCQSYPFSFRSIEYPLKLLN